MSNQANSETLLEIRDTVITLEERSRNYVTLLEKISQIVDRHDSKLNKLDVRVTALESLKDMRARLTSVELELNTLKQDKRWVGIIIAFVSSIASGSLVYFLCQGVQ